MPSLNAPTTADAAAQTIEPIPFGFSAEQCDSTYNANALTQWIARYLMKGHFDGEVVSFSQNAPDGLLPAQGVSKTKFGHSLLIHFSSCIIRDIYYQTSEFSDQTNQCAKMIQKYFDAIRKNERLGITDGKSQLIEMPLDVQRMPNFDNVAANNRATIMKFLQSLYQSAPDLAKVAQWAPSSNDNFGGIAMRDFAVEITKPGFPEKSEYHSPAMMFYPERIVLSHVKNANDYDQKPNPEAHYLSTHVLLCMASLMAHFLQWSKPSQHR